MRGQLFVWSALLAMTLAPVVRPDDASFVPDYHPLLNIQRLRGEIKIDGDLSDSGWKNAARADGFVENSPGDQIKPAVESAALMTYDESNLYVALIAYDNPADIRASLCQRDEIFRDDYFGIMIDTYGDRSWGYEIFVNPLGVQGDLRILGDGNEDASLELVYESRGIVTDSGYQVEMAIPFASLRFPDRPVQTWRLQFWRDRQRDHRYRYSWAALNRDDACWVCQWGTLTGLDGIHPGSNIDLLPSVIGYQSGSRDDELDFHNDDPDAELSFNARYGLTSNSSVELAVNPDFSQVESDASQIDVNTTFALYFEEHRPFFQEGSDLFNTWFTAIYTRTINDPSLATKFTGQFGRWSFAYLLARDDHSPLIVPLQQQSVELALERSTVNIVRARRSLMTDSYVGVMVTDRRTDDFSRDGSACKGGSGTLYGLDSRIRMNQNYHFEFQALGSHTHELDAPDLIDTTQENGTAQQKFDGHTVALDGESFGGRAIYASFERGGRNWNFDFDYWEYTPTFRAENGFETSNDRRRFSFYTDLDFRPGKAWLVNWGPSVEIARVFDYNGTIDLNPAHFRSGTIDEWFNPGVFLTTKAQTQFGINYVASRERFGGVLFNGISRVNVWIDSRPSGWLSLGGDITYGRSIYRRKARTYYDEGELVVTRPEMGMLTDYNVYGNVKLSQRLRIIPEYTHSQMRHKDSYLAGHPDEARDIFSGYIFRVRLNYQFTREWYLRLVVDYNDFAERLAIEPLLTYEVNPYTKFYVGMASRYEHYLQDDYDTLISDEWRTSERQFFAKLQYLFRI